MIILIAESKTMAPCDSAVSHELYESHRPALEERASGIMESLRGASAEELAREVKISVPMARRLHDMIYDFPDKSSGRDAMSAFNGVVFRAFDYATLSADARNHTCSRVRLISSLYGWLRPDDVIKSYRFDFTTRPAPDGGTFAAYLRESVTDRMLHELSETGCRHVLDLLPGDATRCIDWKRVGQAAEVWKVDFRETHPGGNVRTPPSNRLKTLRGHLLRQIISYNIATPEELLSLTSDLYMADPDASAHGSIVFVTAR